jgi:biotin carboxyl carrier protein
MSEKYSKLNIDDTEYETTVTESFINRKSYQPVDPKKILAFIPGLIPEILVKVGQKVKTGQLMLILEAMKMKNAVNAPFNGTIKSINAEAGQNVSRDFVLIEFE